MSTTSLWETSEDVVGNSIMEVDTCPQIADEPAMTQEEKLLQEIDFSSSEDENDGAEDEKNDQEEGDTENDLDDSRGAAPPPPKKKLRDLDDELLELIGTQPEVTSSQQPRPDSPATTKSQDALSADDATDDEREHNNGDNNATEGEGEPEKRINAAVASEIEIVQQLQKGPTEAELRRLKLIELDPDVEEEKIERFNKWGLEVLSNATGLDRLTRRRKLREARTFLRDLWLQKKEHLDVIESYLEKQVGRLFGDLENAPFDPIAYLERDAYSDDEDEDETAPKTEDVKKEEAVEKEAQSKAEAEDVILLSDSEDEEEEVHEEVREEVKKVEVPQQQQQLDVEEVKKDVPLQQPFQQVLLARQQQQQNRRPVFLAPMRINPHSRAALYISLRQQIHQAARDNYCTQRKLPAHVLALHLQIAEHARVLVELLQERVAEEEKEVERRRLALYAQYADDDEVEFGDVSQQPAYAEGEFLSAAERQSLYAKYRRRGAQKDDVPDDDEDEDEEEEDYDGSVYDEEVVDEAEDEADEEAVDEAEDKAANAVADGEDEKVASSSKKVAFREENVESLAANEDNHEEEVGEDDDEEVQPAVRKLSRSRSLLDNQTASTSTSEAPEAASTATTKPVQYGRRQQTSSIAAFFRPSTATPALETTEAVDQTDEQHAQEEVLQDSDADDEAENESEKVEAETEADETHAESQSDNAKPQMPQKKKKTTSGGNALYRLQLEQEAALYKRQERLAYLDDEAEEEDEDMAEGGRAIGGLGDFGFGTQQRLQSLRDNLQEDEALQLRAGDLDHIVDEVSEGEGDEEEGERRRREMEEAEDWQRTKDVVTAITEGHSALKKQQQKAKHGGFSFDALVNGVPRDTHENAETAANPDDELDIEERLLKGLSAKAAREKKRRFYDEFSDDEEEDEDEDGEDVDEGAEGFEGSYEGANEGDDEAALQQQRAQQLALRQRRKQLDHDFKMRRELRHQRILQLQQQQQQQQQSQQQPYATPASHLLQRQSSGSGSRLAMPMGSSLVRASSMQSISVPLTNVRLQRSTSASNTTLLNPANSKQKTKHTLKRIRTTSSSAPSPTPFPTTTTATASGAPSRADTPHSVESNAPTISSAVQLTTNTTATNHSQNNTAVFAEPSNSTAAGTVHLLQATSKRRTLSSTAATASAAATTTASTNTSSSGGNSLFQRVVTTSHTASLPQQPLKRSFSSLLYSSATTSSSSNNNLKRQRTTTAAATSSAMTSTATSTNNSHFVFVANTHSNLLPPTSLSSLDPSAHTNMHSNMHSNMNTNSKMAQALQGSATTTQAGSLFAKLAKRTKPAQ